MILMSISKVPGICDIRKYDENAGKDGGWFPVTSISVGFQKPGESGSGGGANASPAPQKGGSPAGGGENDSGCSFKVTKSVDSASVPIMMLAMAERERVSKKDGLTADIHFIGSVRVENNTSDVDTFTFIRIHLDSMEITEWGVSGSGEGRPEEQFTIGFEKFAMCYESTDGKTVLPTHTKGWDQSTQKPWLPSGAKHFPKFP